MTDEYHFTDSNGNVWVWNELKKRLEPKATKPQAGGKQK